MWAEEDKTMDNKIVKNLITIQGLKTDKVCSPSFWRYDHIDIVIMTDQDNDDSHIKDFSIYLINKM